MAKLLQETSTNGLQKKGARWRAILATPGQGTSGYYSEEILREFGPAAFPAGTKAWIGHAKNHDPRDLLGTYPDGAQYEDGVGLVASLEPLDENVNKFLKKVAPHTGLSMSVSGDTDSRGNVIVMRPFKANSIDLVDYSGLEGAGLQLQEQLYESLNFSDDESDRGSQSAHRTNPSKESSMEIADVQKLLEESNAKLVTSFTEAITRTLTEALKPAAPSEDDKTVEASTLSESLIEAKLPKESRDAVYAQVKAGVKLEEAISGQKTLVDSITKTLTESAGTGFAARVGTDGKVSEDWSLGGWNR